MNYTEFKHSLLKEGVSERVITHGHIVEQYDDSIKIDGEQTQFATIKEAKLHLKSKAFSETLSEQIIRETYEELSDAKVASLIKEFHAIKPTESLVESYIQLAASNMFSIDPVVHKIRSFNRLDRIVEGKLHYALEDDSIVAISEQTQELLNKLLDSHTDIVEHMRQSKEKFFDVVASLTNE